MRNLPKFITLLRLALVPVTAYCIVADTVLEFCVLLLVMAGAAGWIAGHGLPPMLFAVVLATVVPSGTQYVWLWGRRAALASSTK